MNHNPVIKRVPFDYSKSNWAHAALNEVCMLLNIGEVANAHLFLREILANAPIESEPTVHECRMLTGVEINASWKSVEETYSDNQLEPKGKP